MLCARCRTILRRRSLNGRWNATASRRRHVPFFACDGCAALLPHCDSTGIMLTTLTRLAGFGLASLDQPLLSPADRQGRRVGGSR